MLKVGDLRYYLSGDKSSPTMNKFTVKFVGEGSYIGDYGIEKVEADLMTCEEAQEAIKQARELCDQEKAKNAEMCEKMCIVQREVCPRTGQIAVEVFDATFSNSELTMLGLRARLNPSLQYFCALREILKNEGIIDMIKMQFEVLIKKNMLVPIE